MFFNSQENYETSHQSVHISSACWKKIGIFILHVSTHSWVDDWELQPAFEKYNQKILLLISLADCSHHFNLGSKPCYNKHRHANEAKNGACFVAFQI